MLVWGGDSHFLDPTGRRYDPAADAWTPMTPIGSPGTTAHQTAVWTGNEMIVWGGEVPPESCAAGGSRYDPTTDSWNGIGGGGLAGRCWHTATWTGEEMIIFGGVFDLADPEFLVALNDGARYEPIGRTWTLLPTTNAPGPRYFHSAVWTGEKLIVWGGTDSEVFGQGALDTGRLYDPQSNTWSVMSVIGAPDARKEHTAVWAQGFGMIVWGGNGAGVLTTGGVYHPFGNSWSPMSDTDAPAPRTGHTAVWTGDEMIIYGGFPNSNTGGRYDPLNDTWMATSLDGAVPLSDHTAVWTGWEMIVWAGQGARYSPTSDTWVPTSLVDAPSPRNGHVAVWTGSRMIIWGPLDSGGQYLLANLNDNDGDSFAACEDCNDQDPNIWAAPADVTNLELAAPALLSWDDQSVPAGPGTLYDVTSGDLSTPDPSSLTSSSCLQSSTTATHDDQRPEPAIGSAIWYLVRSRNICATATYGTTPRDVSITSCP